MLGKCFCCSLLPALQMFSMDALALCSMPVPGWPWQWYLIAPLSLFPWISPERTSRELRREQNELMSLSPLDLSLGWEHCFLISLSTPLGPEASHWLFRLGEIDFSDLVNSGVSLNLPRAPINAIFLSFHGNVKWYLTPIWPSNLFTEPQHQVPSDHQWWPHSSFI